MEALDQDFARDVNRVTENWVEEKASLMDAANNMKAELTHIINEVSREERAKEQMDMTEHQSQYEFIRNKNIEEDHQMRFLVGCFLCVGGFCVGGFCVCLWFFFLSIVR